MNPKGHPESLAVARNGNSNRLLHGLYSTRAQPLSEGARELVEALLEAPHTVELDAVAALEIASLIDLIGRVDIALSDGVMENRRGQARTLLDVRNRLSGRLQNWLEAVGLTPQARSSWAARLARPTLAEELAALVESEKAER